MAASSMQDIKRRIKSVTSTEHITNAMKLVSAGKLRKAKALFDATAQNSKHITDTIAEIFYNNREIPDRFMKSRSQNDRVCYVLITSSRGLCGGFNSSIIKEAQADMAGSPEKPMILAIGTKGLEFFEKRGFEIVDSYLDSPETISHQESKAMADKLIRMFEKGEIDRVEMIYTSFKSTLEQTVTKVTLLPFTMENNIDSKPEEAALVKEVEYEPSMEAVFNYLVPKYMEMMLYSSIIESATCEHAARRMAMENATDNAREMLSKLSLTYNRARQSAITDEIIEIVAGSEAQK